MCVWSEVKEICTPTQLVFLSLDAPPATLVHRCANAKRRKPRRAIAAEQCGPFAPLRRPAAVNCAQSSCTPPLLE